MQRRVAISSSQSVRVLTSEILARVVDRGVRAAGGDAEGIARAAATEVATADRGGSSSFVNCSTTGQLSIASPFQELSGQFSPQGFTGR